MKVYYFGCVKESGHYLWIDLYDRDRKLFRSQPWGDHLDCELCPSGVQVEGVARHHHKEGWTAIAFYDRSVDTRGNSNSAFIAEGTYTFDGMVTAAKAQWPEVWARFTFEVKEESK